MKKIGLIFMIILIGCKENTGSNKEFVEQQKKDSLSRIDYHEIIDVVLDTFYIQNKDKITRVRYEPSENPIQERYRDNILNNWRLNTEEKELAIRLLDTEKDLIDFDHSKLNQDSQRILQYPGKTTDQNITYYFSSFLSNEKKDRVISTVGAIMNSENKEYRTADSGASLILFFKKGKNNEWKLSNFFTTVEY